MWVWDPLVEAQAQVTNPSCCYLPKCVEYICAVQVARALGIALERFTR